MAYEWLLLDADGTLFDYDAAERQALTKTWNEFGLRFAPEVLTTYRQINARLWREFERGEIASEQLKVERFTRLFDSREIPIWGDEPERFAVQYLHNLGMCTDLIDGAEVVLRALAPRVNLALITNGLTLVQRSRLVKSGLAPLFRAVVISEEEGVAKPDPRIFEIALARMGHPDKETVLMVGDSLSSDMLGAACSGIDTCWFNPVGRPRDPQIDVTYEIRTLDELLQVVNSPASYPTEA